MAHQFFKGQEPEGELPQYIYEHILAKHYQGWTLDYIRSMDYYDFQVHLRLCLVSESIEREFKAALAGALPKKKGTGEPIKKGGGPVTQTVRQRFNPNTGELMEM